VTEEKPTLFSREFIEHVYAIIQDFLLFVLILVLLRAVQLLTERLGLPATVLNWVDGIDVYSKVALLALLSVSLFLRFSKRLLKAS
jgi:hypothetical protein